MMPKEREVGTVPIVSAVVCFTFVLTAGCGFSALVRPQSRSEQLRAACIRPRAPFSPCVAWSAAASPDSLTHHADFDCDFACGLRKLSRDSQRPFSSPSFWRSFHSHGTIFRRLRRAMGQLHSYAFDLNWTSTRVTARAARAASCLPTRCRSASILLVAAVLPWRCLGVSNGHTQHCP